MRVKSLRLKNFRNYEEIELKFEKECNILYGENAQGKTNILEAIYLCATGRSHRTPRDIELVRTGSTKYHVSLVLEKQAEEIMIELEYGQEGKKSIRINEIPVKKLGNLMGNLNAVMFSPEDLMIIKEGPSERRRFLDIAISQLKPSYFYDLQQYAKIITQRNALLKEIQERPESADTLDIWNRHLIRTGSRIIKVRKEFTEKVSWYAKENHRKITNGKEELSLKYQCSFPVSDYESVEEIEKCFERAMNSLKQKEIFKGMTLIGPQRDDCEILLNNEDIKTYGSQGQQRTAVLSIKLSEVDILRDETGENPVLLLDDVMSELDASRQEYLIKNLERVQTFITGTEKINFNGNGSSMVKYYEVNKGKVKETEG